MKSPEIVIDPKKKQIIVKRLVIDHPSTVNYLSAREDVYDQVQSAIHLGVISLSAMNLPEYIPLGDEEFTLEPLETDKADES